MISSTQPPEDAGEIYVQAFGNARAVLAGPDGDAWPYLSLGVGVFLLLALVSWRRHHGRTLRQGLRQFVRFAFPAGIYRHPSSRLDMKMLVAGHFISPAIFLFAGTLIAGVASGVARILAEIFAGWNPDFSGNLLSVAGFTVCLALVTDFSTYVSHRLHHQVPVLWEFHKVHHSAEVLTPLTAFRKHPVYDLVSRAIDVALIGPFQGVVFFLFAGPVDALAVFGVNAVFAAFYLAGSGLRHSHIWLSYGPIVGRILISPAQHQIHHSRARRHWDKNFGEVFAIWDWLFGTLHVPQGREELTFGIDDAERPAHTTLTVAYLAPIANAARLIRCGMPRRVLGTTGSGARGRRPLPEQCSHEADGRRL